jgi:hypothetical protein
MGTDLGHHFLWLLVSLYSLAVVAVAWFIRLYFPAPRLPSESFAKPFAKLAVHVDLPRFNLAVNGRRFDDIDDARERVGSFLEALCGGLGQEDEGARLRAACEVVDRADMLPEALMPLLESVRHPRTRGLLKCATQSLVASHAMRAKRSALGRECPYNSVAGSWRCEVDTRAATVSHEKSERGREGEYEFTWQCVFLIGRRGELLDERAFVTSTQCLDKRLTAMIHRVFE